MALFDQFQDLIRSHAAVKAVGADPFGIKMERVLSPTEAVIEGRPTILVGTNNYLGLTFEPSCISAAAEAIETQGTGTTGSPIATATHAAPPAPPQPPPHFHRRPRPTGSGPRPIPRAPQRHGVHDRLPGHPRHHLDDRRAEGLPHHRRRLPCQHL